MLCIHKLNRDLAEIEVYTNALLTLSLGDGSQPKDGDKYSMEEPMDTDADTGKIYDS